MKSACATLGDLYRHVPVSRAAADGHDRCLSRAEFAVRLAQAAEIPCRGRCDFRQRGPYGHRWRIVSGAAQSPADRCSRHFYLEPTFSGHRPFRELGWRAFYEPYHNSMTMSGRRACHCAFEVIFVTASATNPSTRSPIEPFQQWSRLMSSARYFIELGSLSTATAGIEVSQVFSIFDETIFYCSAKISPAVKRRSRLPCLHVDRTMADDCRGRRRSSAAHQ